MFLWCADSNAVLQPVFVIFSYQISYGFDCCGFTFDSQRSFARLRCLNDRLIVYKLNIEVINRQATIAKDR